MEVGLAALLLVFTKCVACNKDQSVVEDWGRVVEDARLKSDSSASKVLKNNLGNAQVCMKPFSHSQYQCSDDPSFFIRHTPFLSLSNVAYANGSICIVCWIIISSCFVSIHTHTHSHTHTQNSPSPDFDVTSNIRTSFVAQRKPQVSFVTTMRNDDYGGNLCGLCKVVC